MSNQIRPSVTNPTIGTIYNEIEGGLLKLAPDFQRRFVWTQSHMEEFLDTVTKGYPFPEIYVSTGSVDIEARKTVRHVIDGQQRLTTIRNYIDGKFEKPLTSITPYDKLSNTQKGDFLSYEIVVRDLGKIDDQTVREIFRRINLTKFKLDTVEIHNAIYDGHFITTAKSVLDTADLAVFGVFKDSEFSRMGDLHFVLLIMATVESKGYFSQDTAIEGMIEKYNEEYPNAADTKLRVLTALESIPGLGLHEDSMWFRKSNFFTLVAELSLFPERIASNLSANLLALEENVLNNKSTKVNEFGIYYSYMYQATNNRKARVVRSELFRKYCWKPEFVQ